MFFSAAALLFPVYIYCVCRKHALPKTKTPYLPNRTCVWQASNLRFKLTFTPICFCTNARSARGILQHEKRLRKKRKIVITPPSFGQLEKRTSSRATDTV